MLTIAPIPWNPIRQLNVLRMTLSKYLLVLCVGSSLFNLAYYSMQFDGTLLDVRICKCAPRKYEYQVADLHSDGMLQSVSTRMPELNMEGQVCIVLNAADSHSFPVQWSGLKLVFSLIFCWSTSYAPIDLNRDLAKWIHAYCSDSGKVGQLRPRSENLLFGTVEITMNCIRHWRVASADTDRFE